MLPFAVRAERTSAAEALRSDAITGAAESCSTPVMIAVPLSTLILAPIRLISAQCMKRCGKMVSSITEIPGVTAKSDAN